ncbi:MAG: NAD(P)/FAD-dependent oxidoreductase, partial [bacterium]
MGQNVVIIGDGIAGATAAVAARKRDPDAQITIITDEPEPLYNRVQIKDFAKGQRDEASTFIHDLGSYDKNNLRLRLNTRVVEVRDAENRLVTADGTRYSYDKLLLATGGTPRKLPVDGGRAEGVFTFWTFGDARRILAAAKEADHGVVVGAGLLGIDLAVVFGVHGVDTKYLMRGDRWWRDGLSKAGSAIVERGLAKIGVECVFGENVERFVTEKGRITHAVATSGKVYAADIAGVAIGLRYNHDFLKGSRVKVGEGVLTDELMRTSV